MMKTLWIVRAFKFIKRVLTHKYWVGKYCFKCGLYWRGITHDLSKFSPTEFFESVKYYVEGDSPINVSKAQNGWSKCWFHHRGNNLHHYEAWMDKFDSGGVALPMPYEYATEMICDYIGAGKAYQGKKFSYQYELDWWNKKKAHCAMNKNTKAYLTNIFEALAMREAAGVDDPEKEILTPERTKNEYLLTNPNWEEDIKQYNVRTYKD